jgi:putative sterol carrier protein
MSGASVAGAEPPPETDTALHETARSFYRRRVPEQLNDALAAQRHLAAIDAEAARVLEEMQAVRTSIVVQLDLGDRHERFVYDVERGETSLAEEPARSPFLVLGHALADFRALRRECGDSLLGFLGGLAGLGDELRLTTRLVRSLRELDGSLVFERVGADGFALLAHFGPGAPESAPRAVIRIDAETWAALRQGELDPQEAFLSGRIAVSGDEGMAIGLALAAMAPA